MAIDFSPNDYTDCGSGATIDNIWGGGGSCAFWARVDNLTNEVAPVVKSDFVGWATHWAILITQTGDNGGTTEEAAGFYLNNGGANIGHWIAAANAIGANVWCHIVMTYDSDNKANDPVFYVNGTVSALSQDNNPSGDVADDAALDLHAPHAGYNGEIEDLRLYGSILTQEQISALAAGYRGPLGGEVIWLSMNEARGILTPGTLTQGTHLLPDLSVNANDGDPYDSPSLVASDCPRFGGWIGGPFTRTLTKALAGPFVATGTVTKHGTRALAGPLVLTGTVAKKGKRALAGALALTGTIVKKGKKALAGALVLTGVLSKYKLWILFARFRDYFLTAPQRFAISSNKVQMTARYRDYYLTGPEKK